MFQKCLGKAEESLANVNVTPLIDVSLVLVTMLMLASPMTFESGISLKQARGGISVEEVRQEPLRVFIASEEMVEINDAPVTRTGLHQRIARILESGAERPVIVTCADDVSHGTFVSVLDEIKRGGASEIAVAEE
jgi:biopolymer transport protein TolR